MGPMIGHGFSRPQAAVAALACGVLLTLILTLAAAPIRTNDLWFHLGAGRAYATEGLWPATDPMLHTAHEAAPVQHEWLFGVGVYAVKEAVGFHGLRALHTAFVLLTTALAWLCFRRAGLPGPLAFGGTTVFLALSWWRLIQLRPDLISIPAALATFLLLLADERPPPARRIAAVAVLSLLWANAHSLFAIGPALIVAGLLALALRSLLSRGKAQPAGGLARGWATAAGAMLVAGALNPRGLDQHLTFFTSSQDTAIWHISDEWRHLDPFIYPVGGLGLSPLSWGLANILMLGAAVLALIQIWRAWRSPGQASAESLDAVYLGLAAAGSVAMLTSVRFLWMGIFPMLFLFRAAVRLPRAQVPRIGWAAAAGACLVLVAFPSAGGFAARAQILPRDVGTWLHSPYSANAFYPRGIEFLASTDLRGNLFNRYTLGGYLGYWFAPKLRTFVDGRTEHYAPDVLDDYFRIGQQLEVRDEESALEALDRRKVDVYFGVGLPVEGEPIYTTARLDGAPGWVQVSRSVDHSIFVRNNERNRENLQRVRAYYAEAGIGFDPTRGFEPLAVASAHPEWAIARGVVPPDYIELTGALHSSEPAARAGALERLALLAYLLGEYDTQMRWDRESLALRPKAVGPRRRMVNGLLMRGSFSEAALHATELMRATRGRPPGTAVLRMIKEFEQIEINGPSRTNPQTAIHATHLLSRAEMAHFYRTGAPKLGEVPRD